MRQLIHWTARLYPAAWRERYGGELDAMIEDIQPRWEDLFNVLLGALRMQMTTRNSLKILGAVALAGALAAGVFAFRIPDRYISTAVMRMIPAGQTVSDHQRALDRLQQMTHQIVSDRDPAFRKALRIQLLQTQAGAVPAFSISCEYPDKLKAQAVVREVVERFFRLNQRPSAEEQLEVLDPASLPERPLYPNRPVAVGVGLFGGAALGWLAALAWRSTLHSQKT
jgi:LPS O-antigen subunit length determinant protein (WzzB/FepE family)